MPNIIVKIPAATFDTAARASLIAGINATAAECEQIPADPNKRALCWVIIEEIAAGLWTCGGKDLSSILIPVLVVIHLPPGVLDDTARAQYVEGVHQAVRAALPEEKRRIAASCIINEVADGNWGINGAIWHLPDFAHHAGFAHLQGLLPPHQSNQVRKS